jgi:uncharacterized membrane protein
VNRGRLEAFSDGVIAVAITLLALNLAVEGPGHGPLVDQLAHRWPAFVAYLISFFTIGIIWVNHHVLFGDLARVDRSLLFLNLALLLFVVAIPFGTATMATYLTEGGKDSNLAMALYCLIFVGMSASFAAIFKWSLGEGRRHHPIPRESQRPAWIRFTIGGLIYIVAVVVALVSAPVALVIVGLVAVYYIVERTPTVGQPTRQ